MKNLTCTWLACLCLATCSVENVSAGIVVESLGNASSGLIDGTVYGIAPIINAQSGQSAPFNTSIGSDVIQNDLFAANWTFNYILPPMEIIQSASLSIGIWDHDSAASGNQIGSFLVDGVDETASLNLLAEASGGADSMYNVFTLDLSSAALAQLADGSATISLNLAGPGLVTPLFPLPGPNPPEASISNGANLIYSTLAISTVPEPSSMTLAIAGLFCLSRLRRRGD